jgi:hypothetical protein
MPDKFFNIVGSIVTVALVAVLVSSPRLAGIIRAIGDAFASAVNAAQKV